MKRTVAWLVHTEETLQESLAHHRWLQRIVEHLVLGPLAALAKTRNAVSPVTSYWQFFEVLMLLTVVIYVFLGNWRTKIGQSYSPRKPKLSNIRGLRSFCGTP